MNPELTKKEDFIQLALLANKRRQKIIGQRVSFFISEKPQRDDSEIIHFIPNESWSQRIQYLQSLHTNNPCPAALIKTDAKKSSIIGHEFLQLVALSRLVLENVRHIQVPCTTENIKVAQMALNFGADDWLCEPKTKPENKIILSTILETGLTPYQRDESYQEIHTQQTQSLIDELQPSLRYSKTS